MYLFKKTHIFAILSFILLFSGCIKKFDTDGLTLKIEESELNKPSEYFPINQNFVFANIDIKQPNIFISNTNRLNANMHINLSAIFIPSAIGTFTLSGNPYFDKEKSAIFLRDIQVEELKFSNMIIDKNFTDLVFSNMKPVIDTIFSNIPIYKIDKSSFKGSFVKDVKIEDSELLVTFGI
ncbi:DUF1439 domain-containing protein [Arcobacter sp. s6]|jgi:hypothetical protein|uniref:DUF1439 domain-containing protein n=1 Tax=Arcobacter sp. s6 TaxID=3230363 RepID=UPI0034A0A1F1